MIPKSQEFPKSKTFKKRMKYTLVGFRKQILTHNFLDSILFSCSRLLFNDNAMAKTEI